MITDLCIVLQKWRLVHLVSVSALRARYARSVLGQFWLSVTTLTQIVCIGLVWAIIWRQTVDEFLPYYGIGLIIFNLTASTINESSGVFVGDARYYVNDKIPFMLSVVALLYRNILIFLHNIPVICILVLWSKSAFFIANFSIVPALILTLAFVLSSSYLTASICARYRDLAQIVGLIITNLFLLTPIMWRPEFFPIEYRDYILYNPFAAILECLRNPLVGLPTDPAAMNYLICWTGITVIMATLLHRRFEHRLIYWV